MKDPRTFVVETARRRERYRRLSCKKSREKISERRLISTISKNFNNMRKECGLKVNLVIKELLETFYKVFYKKFFF